MRLNYVDVVSRMTVELVKDNIPHQTRYDWVNSQVTRQFFKYCWSSMKESYSAAYRIFADGVLEGALSMVTTNVS